MIAFLKSPLNGDLQMEMPPRCSSSKTVQNFGLWNTMTIFKEVFCNF